MRVAHVIRRFTFDEWGGTENVVWNTVRVLRELEVDGEILATAALSRPGDCRRDGILIRRFSCRYPYWGLTRADRLDLDRKGGNPCSPQLERALVQGRYDLIHVHSGGRIARTALEAARACGIPCCISLHGGYADIPAAELEEMRRPVRGKLHYGGILERLTGRHYDPVARMDAVFCVGLNEYEALARHPGNARVRHLPNGVDFARFAIADGSDPDIRREWGIPPERKLLLCVSRIDYQKNQLLLVRLLSRLVGRGENIHLLLIGPVTSARYEAKIHAVAASHGVWDRLTLIPGLKPDDPRLAAAFRAGDLFLLPSQHEPFGIVVLEAWAAGTPVLASAVGGLKKLVRDGETGVFFQPFELESLLDAYGRVAGDVEFRRRLVAQARREAEQYSWSAMAQKLLHCYRECLHGG